MGFDGIGFELRAGQRRNRAVVAHDAAPGAAQVEDERTQVNRQRTLVLSAAGDAVGDAAAVLSKRPAPPNLD